MESKEQENFVVSPCKCACEIEKQQKQQDMENKEVENSEVGPCGIGKQQNQQDMENKELEMFEVGPCESPYQMGFLIGKRFSDTIRSRLEKDMVLREQLVPFAQTPESKPLIESLCKNNKAKYPTHWDELMGIVDGSEAPALEIILLNFRREILPFIQDEASIVDCTDDCSDLLIVSDSLALAAHNEDASFGLSGYTYLIKGKLQNGICYIAYTHAGEIPSRAFSFNSNGLAFTMNTVRPVNDEIDPGAIGRNFISRDLLESTSFEDAIARIRSAEISLGHNYNVIDIQTRRIASVETASKYRLSVHEVGATPFFHANMYSHLQTVKQIIDENSTSRKKRADVMSKESKDDFLSVIGDTDNKEYPIYMKGPKLYTMCSVLIDLDEEMLSIFQGNPKNKEITHVFSLSELKKP
ncbi:uncharacterized protein LOC120076545 isoform X2 [Benincasa hispida]|uniref:uncharacterized protein LOC120076545 isoform X2 n=1 Tax=Benincasa hispida TaxID=102211 RepID=UPI001900D748|nr:uncharacterized protein LOC120076545 isoform X2 [Benincasa hispida]